MGVGTFDISDNLHIDSFTTLASDVAAIPDAATISKVEIYFVAKNNGTHTRLTCVYLIVTYQAGIIVTPSPVSLVVTRINPTVVLGSLSITPSARSLVAATISPTVILGSVSITPSARNLVATTIAPTVVLGSLSISPSPVSIVLSAVDPTVTIVQPHPAPTDIEIDRATNPTNASDDPLFSAVFQAYGGSGNATHIQIQVAEDSGFVMLNWDSGWIAITSCPDGQRSDEISYGGSGLSSSPPDSQYRYFVRIKFKDAGDTESLWSDTNTFSGVIRPWAAAGYPLRRKLFWNPDTIPQGIPAGYVQSFEFKTGNRQVIATNGDFNEAIQASGGFQIGYHQGRTHIIYLGRLEYVAGAVQLTIYIQSYDHQSGQWGTPFRIGGASSATYFDTHYFPTLVINKNSGHIHAAYGAHGGLFRYTRTNQANKSGALPGDPQDQYAWINPQTNFPGYGAITGFDGTYPVGIYVPSKNRIYWLSRDGTETNWHFTWSANDGQNWSTVRNFIASTSGTRVYTYGIRYDPVKQRLHISWTHEFTGNVARGIWYAYSNLDETDGNSPTNEGFNLWRWADGTVAGYTAGGSGSPIDYNVGKAIRFADDYLASIFTETLVLDKSGEPIVFWEQKLLNTAVEYARETSIWGGKYSLAIGTPGGTWNPIAISEDVDLMLRVRRSSFGVMTNKQGVIKLYMPVSGKTYNQHKPTADVDSVNITRHSEAFNYLEVDDGFSGCDLDGSYCDVGATTGKMSFTSNREIPNAITFFSVSIVGICNRISGDKGFKFYISNGTTDNDGSSQSPTSSYAWYESVWTQNPFTSQPWTKSDLESLEFGIKNIETAVIRITSIFMRVLYSIQSDDENTTPDIWELTSADDGYTWTKREWSRNSGIGIPIFNHKHDLSNDTIEIVWTSGFDIFYLTDEPFGLVQMTGQDLRLFYNGAEIDRLVDYTNKNMTRISVRVQQAIPTNARAGPADYELYFGNKNETGQPKSDPNQVFAFQDNLETYAEAENVNGKNGWTAVSGTWQIWRSPPLSSPLGDGHANKVGAGMQSVRCFAAGILERTLGSSLQNVYIEALLWLEGTTGECYIEVEDSSTIKFGVGIKSSTSKGGYCDNGTWVDSDSVYACRANMDHVALLITSAGCSAWVNNQIVADEIPGISTVDKFRLVAPSQAFFDLIQQSYGGISPVVEIQALEARGFYMDAAILGGGTHSFIADCKIDGDFIRTVSHFAAENITEITMRELLPVSLRRLLSPMFNLPIEHLGFPIVSARLSAEFGTSFSVPGMLSMDIQREMTMRILLAASSLATNKINSWLATDYLRQIISFQKLSVESLDSLELTSLIAAEALYGMNAKDYAPVDFTGLLSWPSMLSTESLKSLRGINAVPVDATSRLSARTVTPADILHSLITQVYLSTDLMFERELAFCLPIELLIRAYAPQYLPLSPQGSLTLAGMIPVANRMSIFESQLFSVETLVARMLNKSLPVEELQILQVLTGLPSVWSGTLSGRLITPAEIATSRIQTTTSAVETLEVLVRRDRLPAAAYKALAAMARLPVAWLGSFRLEMPGHIPVSVAQTIEIPNLASIEIFASLSQKGPSLMVDLIGNWVIHRSLQTSWSGSLVDRFIMPIEFKKSVTERAISPVERLEATMLAGYVPVEPYRDFQLIAQVPVSWQGTLALEMPGSLPVSFVGTIEFLGMQPVEVRQSLLQQGPGIAIDFMGNLIIPHSIPVGSLKQMAAIYELPVAGDHSIVTLRQSFVEFLEERHIAGLLPIGAIQTQEIIGMLPVEWFGGIELATLAVSPIEWRMTMDMKGQLNAEHLVDRMGSIMEPIESFAGLSIKGTLPVDPSSLLSQIAANVSLDWLRERNLLAQVAVESMVDLQRQFRLSIESLAGKSLDIELPASWEGTILTDFPGVLPVCWESVLTNRGFVPTDNLHAVSTRGGNLLIEWNVDRNLSGRLAIEHNETVEVAGKLLSDWLHTVNCQGRLSIESRGTIENISATFAIEHNQAIVGVSQIPLAELLSLAASARIPAEWIGLTFAFLCVRNIKLTVPNAIQIALQIPGVSDANIYVPGSTGIILKGGEGCQTT
jgi:hypothetical protein